MIETTVLPRMKRSLRYCIEGRSGGRDVQRRRSVLTKCIVDLRDPRRRRRGGLDGGRSIGGRCKRRREGRREWG